MSAACELLQHCACMDIINRSVEIGLSHTSSVAFQSLDSVGVHGMLLLICI